MKLIINFPIPGVNFDLNIDGGDNEEIAHEVFRSYWSIFKGAIPLPRLKALFDVGEDGLVEWASHPGFQLAHGLIHVGNTPAAEFWVRSYED